MSGDKGHHAGIAARSVGKRLGGRVVLHSVDLDVRPGEIGLIAGANGSGKTTLVRILSTVVTPDNGQVLVGGADVRRRPAEVRRQIGVVFVNDRSLFWRLDSRTNLRLFGRLAGCSRDQVRQGTTEVLDALGLGDLADRRVGALSTGQRQRLMLARALLPRPSVLLLDEPLRGLDDDGLAWVSNALLAERDRGVAVLAVAPIVRDLLGVADRAYRLADGHLEPLGADAGGGR